jgi:peptidyl-tRNA hydrolase, PTH1 family
MNFLQRIFSLFKPKNTKNIQENQTQSDNKTMKYLIVGLGNIGAEYQDTRHNIGFSVVDALAEANGVMFKNETLGAIAEFRHKGRIFVLLKPSTYMNRSGKAVNYWVQKQKITQENLLVVLDDLNLPFAKQRLRPNGSDGGHNGLKDIDLVLGNNNYARLRIGISDNFSKGRQADYVLGKWTSEERKQLPDILQYAIETLTAFGTIGLGLTMTQFNKK